MRALVLVLLVTFLIFVVVATARGDEKHRRTIGQGQVRFDGHGPEWWARAWRRDHRELQQVQKRLRVQRRVLLSSPTVVEAINLAAATYGNGSTLWRKARCESGLNRYARNPSSASGLFQFLPSTWRSTPYGSFSIWSPYANALAAGWMHVHGRGGEWVCQ